MYNNILVPGCLYDIVLHAERAETHLGTQGSRHQGVKRGSHSQLLGTEQYCRMSVPLNTGRFYRVPLSTFLHDCRHLHWLLHSWLPLGQRLQVKLHSLHSHILDSNRRSPASCPPDSQPVGQGSLQGHMGDTSRAGPRPLRSRQQAPAIADLLAVDPSSLRTCCAF